MARATRGKTKNPQRNRINGVEAIRKKLVQQRQEILDLYVNDLRMGQQTQNDGAEDLVDRANDAYVRQFMLSLSGNERDLLLEIDEALVRLDGEEFGTCGHCEKKIASKRLQAVPWARYCVDCQELSEQGILHES
ncbi:MAG: TraR/DksA family transcriptional regulator [Acidobacteriota bacterium]|nr:TraR/DksA family transcriptional regulator [Acidobacteriota bacterium]